MQTIICLALIFLNTLSAHAIEDALPGSGRSDLGIGWRLAVITMFLLAMWYGLKTLAERIKTGKLEMPKFSSKGNKLFASWGRPAESKHPKFNLEPVQRQIFPDGSELWVLENQGRYILLSKTLQSGIRFICDLDSEPSASDIQDAGSPLAEALRRI